MAETLEFELVSPARLLVSEPAEMVVVPGVEGNFGAMPQHAPFLSTVRPGVVEVHRSTSPVRKIFVAGGFAEVTAERCTLLAEEAIPLDEIDREAALARLQSALAVLQEAETPSEAAAARRSVTVAQALVDALP
ncbi:F0F1 ATP synthase subunit epsilon [Haematospirillum jordaniae]|uniref:ATP synthase epsilon chain n=1 Tax=Haematospirillum jordaniae TaxID=1549855 RepID=A0A143DD67_9PROT|nr:F0F1 ATP synthase subunit epsilon [Haematospirillum jordaniae]AMW34616.1 ATP synthase subunit epsilon [Haematospirillum jordaniae]NKD44863.1 F0F1 ATP synthase subunit epsilon [Haematospirillum jordaniae]NKD57054.1 F0F1 ATP synthase subunit epsilon [Haematospirillum jordaniae]NKD58790.1 F0F1 ATP synthase subunit epsilon [Haematospirillum jordaniae]NKD66979.1 F0F1 ATP synthase subunit epsilon [Haematospirillum jordaniae]